MRGAPSPSTDTQNKGPGWSFVLPSDPSAQGNRVRIYGPSQSSGTRPHSPVLDKHAGGLGASGPPLPALAHPDTPQNPAPSLTRTHWPQAQGAAIRTRPQVPPRPPTGPFPQPSPKAKYWGVPGPPRFLGEAGTARAKEQERRVSREPEAGERGSRARLHPGIPGRNGSQAGPASTPGAPLARTAGSPHAPQLPPRAPQIPNRQAQTPAPRPAPHSAQRSRPAGRSCPRSPGSVCGSRSASSGLTGASAAGSGVGRRAPPNLCSGRAERRTDSGSDRRTRSKPSPSRPQEGSHRPGFQLPILPCAPSSPLFSSLSPSFLLSLSFPSPSSPSPVPTSISSPPPLFPPLLPSSISSSTSHFSPSLLPPPPLPGCSQHFQSSTLPAFGEGWWLCSAPPGS